MKDKHITCLKQKSYQIILECVRERDNTMLSADPSYKVERNYESCIVHRFSTYSRPGALDINIKWVNYVKALPLHQGHI